MISGYFFSLAKIITENKIKIVPITNDIVSGSLNNNIPIIILTIGSQVASIEVEEAPIIFRAFINNIVDIIVDIIDISRIEEVI